MSLNSLKLGVPQALEAWRSGARSFSSPPTCPSFLGGGKAHLIGEGAREEQGTQGLASTRLVLFCSQKVILVSLKLFNLRARQ